MNHRWRLLSRAVALAVALVVGLSACAGGSDLDSAANDVADTYLEPSYDESNHQITALTDSVGQLCAARNDETLLAAQDAWRVAESSWMNTTSAWFGPTTMDRADSDIGYQPSSGSGIEETMASEHLIDEPFVSDSLPTTQKGLGALEYVLFVNTPIDDRRCEFLTAVALNLQADSADLTDSWLVSWDGNDAYVEQFRGIGSMGQEPRESLGLMTGGIIELTKKLTLNQIGKVLGITSPTPNPDAYPEGEAGYGMQALRDQIDGLVVAYGAAPASLSGAVASRDADVDEIIQSALAEAVTYADALLADNGTSFAAAVEADPDTVRQLYDALAIVRRTFETDVDSLLDLTLGFSDSDGDTG